MTAPEFTEGGVMFRFSGFHGSAVSKRVRGAARFFVTGWRSRESLSAPVAENTEMATAVQKITLPASRDIPFNKLVLSPVQRPAREGRRLDRGAGRGHRPARALLQSLNVRPVLDADGDETGMFEIPGGRSPLPGAGASGQAEAPGQDRARALRGARSAAIPAEEDSLAENVQRVALHPLDQFRAFQTLRDKGLSEEDIAARFFVTPAVVKQRLRLAAVSEKLLDVYAEDGMTLEQLMAFTVTDDHARQEQVWEGLSSAPTTRSPTQIRRMLTEAPIRASDKRAQFVGVDAYEAAGGVVMRDLFQQDDGGWLQDPALLDRLVTEKLKAEAENAARRGLEVDRGRDRFPLRPHPGLRQLVGQDARSHRRGTGEPSRRCERRMDRLEAGICRRRRIAR